MNYDLGEDQKIIKETARKFLAGACPAEFVRKTAADPDGSIDELWTKMAELGWMGLMVPEEYDGFGGTILDLTVLLSEMGYVALPGPFFSTVVLGGLTLMEAGSPAQKAEFLPALAAGNLKLALAWLEEDGDWGPSGVNMYASREGDSHSLSGTKLFVGDAAAADFIICVARTEARTDDPAAGLSLFLIDRKSKGLTITPLLTLAGDKQYEVVFDQVAASPEALLGEPGRAWPVLKKILLLAAAAKCGEMIGAADKVMELVIPYTKERVQFGRQIGAFQAVQHHAANMLTYADTIKFLTYQAAWLASSGLPFEKEAAMCKAWVSDSFRKLVGLGHQILGGVGFMEEHDLQLYYKRAKTAELMFGGVEFHLELAAEAMGL
ncbi:MAG: acyl-CoA dehydrogenase family protein [Pseudomonadota bacterium]